MSYCTYQSPIGTLYIEDDGKGICRLSFDKKFPASSAPDTFLLKQAVEELSEYFSGKRYAFTLPLSLNGTKFQTKVWNALINIPYGETKAYKDIAEEIGNPKACRAVGMANNKNPIMIIVPCHRVIGINGSLTGYACGIDIKQKLLDLESKYKIK